MAKKKFMDTEQLGKIVTPKGIASWTYIKEPKEDDDGKVKYRITLIWDKNDAQFKAFKEQLLTWRKKTANLFKVKESTVNVPLKELDKDTADKTNIDDVTAGMFQMEFNSIKRGHEVIPVVDGSAIPTDLDPWAGDICKVQANAVGYKTGGNVGVKLYLAGVQIIDKRSGGSMYSADMFEAEEGSEFSDDEGDDDVFGDLEEDSSDNDDLFDD